MRVVELIERKRDGGKLTADEIDALVQGYTKGDVPDYQMSAFCMAVVWRGMDAKETAALTASMVRSGERLDLSRFGRVVDKHSTGGVGDKTSLVAAPLVAACGVPVAKMSGRGLGFSGGTLDKLESIPGLSVDLDPDRFARQVAEIGLAIVGQSPDLAPADGKLYALRDVTATVDFEPFIVSSIVSKKIAEGAGAIVYDVKCGDGAFMREPARARGLAERLVRATRSLDARASAFVTDMNQPLGRAVGNALEVRESIDVLRGAGPTDVRELTLALAARMLVLAGAEPAETAARARAERALGSGAAWRKFLQLVEA